MPSVIEVLDTHWDGKLPVDVKKIAASMGISVVPDPFMDVSGSIELRGTKPLILFNASEAPVRQRFTIAHEIGHYALGHLDSKKKKFRDPSSHFSSGTSLPDERQANMFAARLLMPSKVVKYAVHEKQIRNVEQLADIFKVSQVAMKYRLKNLGMING